MSGLIPARAGNTNSTQYSPMLARAHPRSRGEHELDTVFPNAGEGSSPLARGTPRYLTSIRRMTGLIPARAGNTRHWRGRTCRLGAHPRSRGEHRHSIPIERAFAGSSPLARGTPERCLTQQGFLGLIPARAGNTRAAREGRPGARAHPRSRGEHAIAQRRTTAPRGSSPLARGTL